MERPNLNKIIAQNKDKTGHIPNKGLGSMPGKKTIPYVSMDGFKNGMPPKGTHYRIPSDTLYNPTPYRIKAKANTGQEEWLEPYMNQSVKFPGASYVDEHPQMSHGGWLDRYDDGGLTTTETTRSPIYTNDRALVQQFNDSAYSAKQGQKFLKEYAKRITPHKLHQSGTRPAFFNADADVLTESEKRKKYSPKNYRDRKSNKGWTEGQPALDKINTLVKKSKVLPYGERFPLGVQYMDKLPVWKAPVQPYILQEEPPQIKMVGHERPNLSTSFGVPTVARQTNIQPNQSGDYVLRFGEYNSEGDYTPKEVFFKSRKEADDMMNFLQKENDKRYNTGIYYNNLSTQGNYANGGDISIPNLKQGNWLDKYQEGGSYVVKKGDTLSKISKETGVPVNELIRANKIKDANVIGVNQKLVLPVAGQPAVEQEWQNWSDINKYNQYLNSLQDEGDYSGDERRISAYYKNQPDEIYTVVDKKRGRMNVYKGNTLVNTYPVGTGENAGDAQTVTKIANGKVDWSAGNKMTGAGVYTVAGSQKNDPHYSNAASWNFANDQGENVAMALHSSFVDGKGDRTARLKDKDIANNRMSNGCVNGICYNLDELYNTGYTVGNKMYVLPEDRGNTFQIVDGKPVLRVNTNINNYNQYKDAKGRVQKGQGVNRSVNTLVYKPVQGIFDRANFQKNVYTAFDLNDEKEYQNTTKPYYTSLVNNKKKVMQAANIPSDVYNEIARIAFGIYGAESNFGDEHTAANNLVKAVRKIDYGKTIGNLFTGNFKIETDDAVGGPDVKAKAGTYGADDKNQSVGYTQLRWAQLNNDEKKALAKVGITKNTDFLDPTKAAMGTAVVLGVRYNQQLTSEEKKDLWKYLPTKWNKRSNYADRVKSNAQYLTFRQYDDKRKMGGEPCYECGGMYKNGGSTSWLNEYL